MSILVVRHEPLEHLGHFAAILKHKQIPFFYKDLGEDLALDAGALDAGALDAGALDAGALDAGALDAGALGAGALDVCHGLILMGGPQSANGSLPGLRAELKLIEQAVVAETPILGICLGAQLIAKALGARVYGNPEKEIGWAPVYFTEAAARDPVFAGVDSPSTVFHWHAETFDLPAGAQWLAYSDQCLHQAFRFGPSVYGVQFHPEITPEMIVDWSAALDAPLDPHAADTEPLARRILEGWLTVFR